MKVLLFASIMFFYSAGVYSLEIYAQPVKQHYLPGEKVGIIVTLENRSSTRVAVPLRYTNSECPDPFMGFVFSGRLLEPIVECASRIRVIDTLWLYPGGKYTLFIKDLNHNYRLPDGQHSVTVAFYTKSHGTCDARCGATCKRYPPLRRELWCGTIYSESFVIRIGN